MRAILALAAAFLAFVPATYAKEIKLTPEMVRDVTRAIQGRGYNCPQAKLAFAKGEDQFGTVVQVYCGPAGQDGVYEKAVFRLTFRPNNSVIVHPWR